MVVVAPIPTLLLDLSLEGRPVNVLIIKVKTPSAPGSLLSRVAIKPKSIPETGVLELYLFHCDLYVFLSVEAPEATYLYSCCLSFFGKENHNP